MDVYTELQGVLVPRYVPRGFVMRAKPVKRKYAFDMSDVPRGETEYLKVWYVAKGSKPPTAEMCSSGGKTYQRIFGGRTTLLENFLIKRKVRRTDNLTSRPALQRSYSAFVVPLSVTLVA